MKTRLRGKFLLGLAGLLFIGCSYTQKTDDWSHIETPSEISTPPEPLEKKLEAPYTGLTNYEVFVTLLGQCGVARFKVEEVEHNNNTLYHINFNIYIGNDFAAAKSFRELNRQTIAYFDGKMRPLEYRVKILKKKRSNQKKPTVQNKVFIYKKGVVVHKKAEFNTDENTYDPLCLIYNLITTPLSEIKSNLDENNQLSLGNTGGDTSLIEIMAKYDEDDNSITLDFSNEIFEGGGKFTFFYKNGRIDTGKMVMSQNWYSSITFKEVKD